MMSRSNRVPSGNEFSSDSAQWLEDLIKGLIVPFMAGAIISWIQFASLPEHWRLLAAAGIGLSIAAPVYAGTRHRRANRRNIRAFASRHGLKFSVTGNQDLAERIKTTNGQDGDFSLDYVAEGRYNGIELLVGELVVKTGRGNSRKTTRETVVYAWDPDLQLPRFALQTEGKLMSWAADLVRLHDIDFAENPQFSNRYHLSSQDPVTTQKLFRGELVQLLGESEGWEIRGKDDVVLFCSRNRTSRSVKWLLEDSCRLFDCFKMAARRNGLWNQSHRDLGVKKNHAGKPRGKRNRISPQDYLNRMEGAGIVKWGEVKRFLRTPPPRQVGPRIVRELVSVPSFLAMIVSVVCIFFIIGGSLLLFLSIPGSQPRHNDWMFGVVFGLLMIAISCLVLVTGYRERSRCNDLLRHGRIAKSMIKSLRPTKSSSKGSHGHAAGVHYVVGGKRYREELTLYGTHVDYVRDAMKYQQPVHLIHHPQSPDRIRLAIQLTTSTKVTI